MEKEVLVKVGFVTGTTKAFDDAAKMAKQAGGQVAGAANAAGQTLEDVSNSAGKAFEEVAKKQSKKGKGSIVGGIEEGLKGIAAGGGIFKMLGLAGAAAGAVGKISSDVQMFGSGTMLRGQGLTGMLGDIKDFFTGRSTRESLEDFKLMKSDFNTNILAQTLERSFQKSTALREASNRPITEVDPLKRQAEELALVRKRISDTEDADFKNELVGLQEKSKNFAGKNTYADWVDAAAYTKLEVELQKSSIRYKEQLRDLSKQELAVTAQQFEAKKSMVRGGKIAFGEMTVGEQQFALKAAERYKAGEQLHPSEVGILRRSGIGGASMDQYSIDRAEKRGFTNLAALVGDKEVSKAAQASLTIGGTIEANLDTGKEFERVFKKTEEFVKKTEAELDKMTAKARELEITLHKRLNIERKLQ